MLKSHDYNANMKIWLSILTAAYNKSAQIEETFKSIKANLSDQFALEWVIVDDNSTDNTFEVINNFDKHFDILVEKNSANLGPGATYNKALQKARGQYCMVLDADDLLTARSLPTRYAEITRSAEYKFFVGQGLHINSDSTINPSGSFTFSDKSEVLDRSRLLSLLKREIVLPLQGVIIEREFLNGLGGWRNLSSSQDLELWIRMLASKREGLYTPLASYIYRLPGKHHTTLFGSSIRDGSKVDQVREIAHLNRHLLTDEELNLLEELALHYLEIYERLKGVSK